MKAEIRAGQLRSVTVLARNPHENHGHLILVTGVRARYCWDYQELWPGGCHSWATAHYLLQRTVLVSEAEDD